MMTSLERNKLALEAFRKKLGFLIKLAKRKGVVMGELRCAETASLRVKEVIPAAKGCFVQYDRCNGCSGESSPCPILDHFHVWSEDVLPVGTKVRHRTFAGIFTKCYKNR